MKISLIVLHSITALFGITACFLLYDISPGSHPPLIIFMPVAMAIWIALHLVLAAIQWLETKENKRRKTGSSAPWPILLIVAVIIYLPGMLKTPLYLLNVVSSPLEWHVNHTVTACLLLFKLTILLSILLRWRCGHYLVGSGLILIGVFPFFSHFSGLVGGYKFDIQQLMILASQVPLIAFGVLILVSPSIKAFFGHKVADQGPITQ